MDASGAAVQLRDVAEIFTKLAGSSPTRARKVALIVATKLAELQGKLVFETYENLAIFSSFEDASLWLAEAASRTPDSV